ARAVPTQIVVAAYWQKYRRSPPRSATPAATLAADTTATRPGEVPRSSLQTPGNCAALEYGQDRQMSPHNPLPTKQCRKLQTRSSLQAARSRSGCTLPA